MALALVALTGPATATTRTAALNPTAQAVSVARWTVVLKDGATPATGPSAPMPYNALLGTSQYSVLTNTGTVTPGSVIIKSAGLSVTPTVQGCLVAWTGLGTVCSTGAFPVALDPSPVTPAPIAGQTYYLRIVGALSLGATMVAVTTAPASAVANS